jgi:hypothetical protein
MLTEYKKGILLYVIRKEKFSQIDYQNASFQLISVLPAGEGSQEAGVGEFGNNHTEVSLSLLSVHLPSFPQKRQQNILHISSYLADKLQVASHEELSAFPVSQRENLGLESVILQALSEEAYYNNGKGNEARNENSLLMIYLSG